MHGFDPDSIWEAGYTQLARELLAALPPRVAARIRLLLTDEYALLDRERTIRRAVERHAPAFCARQDVQVLGLGSIVGYLDLATEE